MFPVEVDLRPVLTSSRNARRPGKQDKRGNRVEPTAAVPSPTLSLHVVRLENLDPLFVEESYLNKPNERNLKPEETIEEMRHCASLVA